MAVSEQFQLGTPTWSHLLGVCLLKRRSTQALSLFRLGSVLICPSVCLSVCFRSMTVSFNEREEERERQQHQDGDAVPGGSGGVGDGEEDPCHRTGENLFQDRFPSSRC